MLFFRADGNPQIGTGHIMRCLSLADAFREQGIDAAFIAAGADMRPLIQKRGYECLVLDSAYDRMEEELPALLRLLDARRPACVILDSYFVTPDYMRAVRTKAPLVYMDDLNAFDYPADVVVNYNLYSRAAAYPSDRYCLLGPQYAPLRQQFRRLVPYVVRERAEGVLFSTGGTDPYHIALRCVEYLRENPPEVNTVYHLILGAMNQDAGQIRGTAAGLPYIILHQQVTDMCGLMRKCDIAVSAAGTTLYELCACGVPAVTYVLADNQIDGAAAFQEAGIMPCAGDVREEPEFVRCIFSELQRLMDDWEARRKISARMQNLVDGMGAERLAAAISEMFILNI